MRPETRMLFLETPTNPVMRLTDIAGAAELAHARGLKVIVDNTFASPCVQRPIELGADLVVHSTTKYLNGHSDSVGGIVVGVRDEDLEWLKFIQNAEGAILSPFDSWLILRGTKTLALRMAQHNINGLALAEFLASHPAVNTCSTPDFRATRSTTSPGVRCEALAACFRSTSERSRTPNGCATG